MGKLKANGLTLALVTCLIWSKCAPAADDYASLVLDGHRYLDSGDAESAVTAFQQAYQKMQAANQSSDSLSLVLIDLSTAYLETGNYSQAERAILTVADLPDRTPNVVKEAELINNQVCIQVHLGHYSEAKAASERALRMIEDVPAAVALMPNILDDLATAEIYLGEDKQALRHQQDAVQRWQTLLPADHTELINGYSVLATAQYLNGQFGEARISIQNAVSAAERRYGLQSPRLGRLLRDQLIVLRRLGLKREIRDRERELNNIPATTDLQKTTYARAATAVQRLP